MEKERRNKREREREKEGDRTADGKRLPIRRGPLIYETPAALSGAMGQGERREVQRSEAPHDFPEGAKKTAKKRVSAKNQHPVKAQRSMAQSQV